ncbi:MAG: DUF4340 domain-containing protein [Clostridia bacterium]|nr:DUF4340 domain-containing protein [Clostridia bacterium]
MRTEETIINIIFDAGKGSVSVPSREGICGQAYGTLPQPSRRGYRFDGWYLGETQITPDTVIDADEDIRLTAHWVKSTKTDDRKASSLKRQKMALIALAIIAVMLVIVLAVVARLITIYPLVDTYVKDGVEYSDTYWIKQENGVYALFDGKGVRMETNGEENSQIFIARGSGNQYSIDPDTGEYSRYAVVDTVGSEVLGYNNHVLIYPQIQQSYVYSVEVTNGHGSYKFYHAVDGIYIDGYKDSAVQFDQTLYAYLVVSCGYTLSTMKLDLTSADSTAPRLEDGTVDYSAYGLDDPQAVYTITGIKYSYDDSGKPVIEYDADGNYIPDPDSTYTVKVGDAILSGSGYYVQPEGRDEVYILDADIEKTVLQPIEALVTPLAVAPASLTYHSMAYDFCFAYLESWLDTDDIVIDENNLIAAFTYEDLKYRSNTLNTIYPYICNMELMDGYQINDSNASEILSNLYSLECVGCVELGLSREVLEEYGLTDDVYYLTYTLQTGDADEKGEAPFVTNEIIINPVKNENGTYYVASILYDMIVEVDQAYLNFLEWDNIDWYNPYFYGINMAHAKEMNFQFGDAVYNFTLDNSLSYAYYLVTTTDSSGKSTTTMNRVDLSKGSVYYEGEKPWYKITSSGKAYPIEVIIDFDTVKSVTVEEALTNSSLENIIYVYNDTVYYRYKSGMEIKLTMLSDNLRTSCEQYTGGVESEHLLDYSFTHTTTSSTGTVTSATLTGHDNFRNLYGILAFFCLEGDVDETEFESRMGMSISEYLASDTKVKQASISYRAEDLASLFNASTVTNKDGETVRRYTENNEKYVVINFYQYTDWKSLVTIEALEKDENGNWVSNEDSVVGRFYVLTSYLEKLESDVQKVLNKEYVDDSVKY